MVVSGNNSKKTEYILEAVSSGIHVLADKPMVITPGGIPHAGKGLCNCRRRRVFCFTIS